MNKNVTLVVVGLIALYLLLGAWSLASQQEGLRGKTGAIWIVTDRAVVLLGRLEQQMTVFMSDRQDLITQITSARNDMLAAQQTGNLELLNAAQQQAGLAISVVVENYPNLDLTAQQTALMDETAGSVNRIAFARKELVDSQVGYNQTRIFFFPLALVFPRVQVLGEFHNPSQSLPPSTFGTSVP